MALNVLRRNLFFIFIIAFVIGIVYLNQMWKTTRVKHLMQQDPPEKRRSCISDFQMIEKDAAYAYSAYVDDRRARDVRSSFSENADSIYVRSFVYLLWKIDATRAWKCLLWYEDQQKPVVVNVSSVTDIDPYNERLRFQVAMVVCNLPQTPSHYKLHAISFAPISSSNITNYLCVENLRQRKSSILLRSVSNDSLNGSAENLDSKTEYNVTFAICTNPFHGDYYTPKDIVNFIEVNRMFGAEKFIFHIDGDLNHPLRSCMESYRDLGVVEIYPFNPPNPDGLIFHGQMITIQDCIYRTMYRVKYLININIDEVIVPLHASNWLTMLNDIHNGTGENGSISYPDDKIAVYSFRNQFMYTPASNDPTFDQDILVKQYNIKTLLKTSKCISILPHGIRSKIMARPEKTLIWHVHVVMKENIIDPNDVTYYFSENDALLFHYRDLDGGKRVRDRRMHEFASTIIERIRSGIGHCTP